MGSIVGSIEGSINVLNQKYPLISERDEVAPLQRRYDVMLKLCQRVMMRRCYGATSPLSMQKTEVNRNKKLVHQTKGVPGIVADNTVRSFSC